MATNNEILEILELLSGAYNGAKPANPRGWYLALEDYDGETLRAAVKDCMRLVHGYPFPQIADFVEIAERKRRDATAQEEDNTEARMYWRSMDLFGALLRGSITEQQFAQDKAVKRQNLRNGLFADWEFEELICEA